MEVVIDEGPKEKKEDFPCTFCSSTDPGSTTPSKVTEGGRGKEGTHNPHPQEVHLPGNREWCRRGGDETDKVWSEPPDYGKKGGLYTNRRDLKRGNWVLRRT